MERTNSIRMNEFDTNKRNLCEHEYINRDLEIEKRFNEFDTNKRINEFDTNKRINEFGTIKRI